MMQKKHYLTAGTHSCNSCCYDLDLCQIMYRVFSCHFYGYLHAPSHTSTFLSLWCVAYAPFSPEEKIWWWQLTTLPPYLGISNCSGLRWPCHGKIIAGDPTNRHVSHLAGTVNGSSPNSFGENGHESYFQEQVPVYWIPTTVSEIGNL